MTPTKFILLAIFCLETTLSHPYHQYEVGGNNRKKIKSTIFTQVATFKLPVQDAEEMYRNSQLNDETEDYDDPNAYDDGDSVIVDTEFGKTEYGKPEYRKPEYGKPEYANHDYGKPVVVVDTSLIKGYKNNNYPEIPCSFQAFDRQNCDCGPWPCNALFEWIGFLMNTKLLDYQFMIMPPCFNRR